MKQIASRRVVRYVVVGGVAYGIEMVALYMLSKNLSPVVAVGISFWIGFVVAFVLQKYVAFQHRDVRPHVIARQFIIYSALVAWNYAFTLVVAQLFGPVASIFVLRTIVILVVTIWNFAVYRALFREPLSGEKTE